MLQVGTTAVHLAAAHGNIQMLRLLKQHGAELTVSNSEGMSALHMAVCRGQMVTAQWLAEHELSLDQVSVVPITTAVHLLDWFGPSQRWGSPIQAAASMGHLSIVKWLMDKQVCVEANRMARDSVAHHLVQGDWSTEAAELCSELLRCGP